LFYLDVYYFRYSCILRYPVELIGCGSGVGVPIYKRSQPVPCKILDVQYL
jgi:hypothetical protein